MYFKNVKEANDAAYNDPSSVHPNTRQLTEMRTMLKMQDVLTSDGHHDDPSSADRKSKAGQTLCDAQDDVTCCKVALNKRCNVVTSCQTSAKNNVKRLADSNVAHRRPDIDHRGDVMLHRMFDLNRDVMASNTSNLPETDRRGDDTSHLTPDMNGLHDVTFRITDMIRLRGIMAAVNRQLEKVRQDSVDITNHIVLFGSDMV